MNLTLNENEAQVLTGLIDIAIKAAGLQVAEAGVALARRIADAAQAAAAAPSAPSAQVQPAGDMVEEGTL